VRIETTKDFKRPRVAVLNNFRDPARIEGVLQELGALPERTSEPPDMAWACAMMWRDEPRKFVLGVREIAVDETTRLTLDSSLANAEMTLDFYDLDDGGCRVMAAADLTAHTVMAKLALQSLRLVRGKAEDRLTRFISAIGRH